MADVRVAEVSEADVGVADIAVADIPAAYVAKPEVEDLGVVDEAGDRSTDIPSAGEIGRHRKPKRARIDKAGDSVTEVEPAGDQLAEVLDARDSRASRGEVEEAGTIAAHVANARHGTGTGVEESRRRGGRRVPESGAAGISMSGILIGNRPPVPAISISGSGPLPRLMPILGRTIEMFGKLNASSVAALNGMPIKKISPVISGNLKP